MSIMWPSDLPDEVLNDSAALGFATMLFWARGFLPSYFWVIPAHILPALRHRQLRFSFDESGKPQALVAWAYLSDEKLAEMKTDASCTLHISDWNEGTNLWIMAAFGRRGGIFRLAREALRAELAGFDVISGFGRDPGGNITRLRSRVLTRRRGRAAANETASPIGMQPPQVIG